jgi:hypothetical protein
MKKNLFICMIFVATGAFSQEKNAYNKIKPFANLAFTNFFAQSSYLPKTIIPGNFYTQQLGFFCKKELKFEAMTKIPLKIRLGSVAHCDWMEGKRNAGILPQN